MGLFSVCIRNLAVKEPFTDGPLITSYSPHAKVEQSYVLAQETKLKLKVAFDVAEHSGDNLLNRKSESLARFLNMHVANGISTKNIQLALVVPGNAGLDLLNHQT
jgi:hypothetical protein